MSISAPRVRLRSYTWLGPALSLLVFACSSDHQSSPQPLAKGQSEFLSAPPSSNGAGRGVAQDGESSGNGASVGLPPKTSTPTGSTPRTVEETDIYRFDASSNRLYYLNQYRGLMVFDLSDVDHPRFLGRSPIYGTPEQMIVRGGVATVVVSDWYGRMDNGTPFHGSIVRGIDATDPTQMKILGEAQLGGGVRDTRVVGDVLYAVTEEYPYYYGWETYGVDGGASTSTASQKVSVSSVSFAGGAIKQVDQRVAPGGSGLFYVTDDAILFAYSVYAEKEGYPQPTGESVLEYVDISDPAGSIRERGSVTFRGFLNGWGTDNGRWNIDFADKTTAHALACSQQYCGSGQGLVLASADFSDPDQPKLASTVELPSNSWSPAVRFDSGRMYLSPTSSYYGASGKTPIQIFDLSEPSAPALKGTVEVDGQIWNFTPSGNRLFALGDYYQSTATDSRQQVSLHYLDVSNPSAPKALGTANFGQGWAWTPAAGTFKAFTKRDDLGLVVLPFSGWDYQSYTYNNGLQLIEFTPDSISTSGAAKTRGWVERGIFANGRLISLSDVSLAVVDYTSHAEPKVVSELTLARNVVNVKPQTNGNVAELSSDFWDNDRSTSALRLLRAADIDETQADATLAELSLPGTDARIYHDGALSYVLTQVSRRAACVDQNGKPVDGNSQCEYWHTRVQVVDRSADKPVLRGALDLPEGTYPYYGGWGWYGCFAWDWYSTSSTVQLKGHLLAFQRVDYSSTTRASQRSLGVIDLSNPDQPTFGTTPIVEDDTYWWGNLRAVGDQLYTGHYEWVETSKYDSVTQKYTPGVVRYYLDRIDLSDPAHPAVATRINVPGMLVGASEDNPNLVYTIDYNRWGETGTNTLAVSLLDGGKAYLQGSVALPGYVGNVFVRGSRAYFSVEETSSDGKTTRTQTRFFQANLENPAEPSVLASTPSDGWGWTLDVQGDRAFVQSGWGSNGLDIYKLNASGPPTFDQTVRVRGWYSGSLSRQDNDVYVATGYWGIEHITLK